MARKTTRELSLFDREILGPATIESVRKLAPRHVAKNPVMFVVEVGSVLTTILWLRDVIVPPPDAAPAWFTLGVSLWLWFTVLFANFAEAVAEGRGKAQADTLRKMRKETTARRLVKRSPRRAATTPTTRAGATTTATRICAAPWWVPPAPSRFPRGAS